jgi:hypothetical protein
LGYRGSERTMSGPEIIIKVFNSYTNEDIRAIAERIHLRFVWAEGYSDDPFTYLHFKPVDQRKDEIVLNTESVLIGLLPTLYDVG